VPTGGATACAADRPAPPPGALALLLGGRCPACGNLDPGSGMKDSATRLLPLPAALPGSMSAAEAASKPWAAEARTARPPSVT